jgi:predicted DNA-binding protein (UPF0251 family)
MKTDNAVTYARTVSKLDGKIGEAKPSNEQRMAKKSVQSALKTGKVVKDSTGKDITRDANRLADAIFAGAVTIEKPVEKEEGSGRSTQRTHVERIIASLTEAIRLVDAMVADEDLEPATTAQRLEISKASLALETKLDTIAKRAAKKDAEAAIAQAG